MKLEKGTKPRGTQKSAPRSRWYDDACATAFGLELIGERWSLLIVRELMFGPRRFGELRAGLKGISANVLTQRLEGLESHGLLQRRVLPPPHSVQVYELTAFGYEAEPIVLLLGRWAARHPGHDLNLPVSAASIALSFKAMFKPAAAARVKLTVVLHFPTDVFSVIVHQGAIQVRRGDSSQAELRLTCDPATLAGLLYGGQATESLEASGALEVTGSRSLLRRFTALFAWPSKATLPAIATESSR